MPGSNSLPHTPPTLLRAAPRVTGKVNSSQATWGQDPGVPIPSSSQPWSEKESLSEPSLTSLVSWDSQGMPLLPPSLSPGNGYPKKSFPGGGYLAPRVTARPEQSNARVENVMWLRSPFPRCWPPWECFGLELGPACPMMSFSSPNS